MKHPPMPEEGVAVVEIEAEPIKEDGEAEAPELPTSETPEEKPEEEETSEEKPEEKECDDECQEGKADGIRRMGGFYLPFPVFQAR